MVSTGQKRLAERVAASTALKAQLKLNAKTNRLALAA